MEWRDTDVVKAFVAMYRVATGTPYEITSRADDDLSKQNEESVDALAEAPNEPTLAIEVTKVESFSDQRFDDRQIELLDSTLPRALAPLFPSGVTVLLEAGVWERGFDWRTARSRILEYLRDLPPRLERGFTSHVIDGVPFPIRVEFQPELNLPLRVGRIAPPSQDRREALFSSLEVALRHKSAALAAHRVAGCRAILILESHDIALISHVHVYVAFLRAGGRDVPHLDEVWFCKTYNPHRLDEWYGFRGPQEILDRVNSPNLRLGPAHDGYWEKAISEGRI